MSHYIDGFVLPVPRAHLGDYQRVATEIASIWKECGALDYREFVGDDMQLEGTRSFVDVVGATEEDCVVFGWVTFESREARDLANEKVAIDPRVAGLLASAHTGFEAMRMVYGGFTPLV